MEGKNKEKSNKKVFVSAIWDEIKNLPVQLYSLPAQTVEQAFKLLGGDAQSVYLQAHNQVALPALEETLGCDRGRKAKYTIEQAEGYIMVRLSPTIPSLEEFVNKV